MLHKMMFGRLISLFIIFLPAIFQGQNINSPYPLSEELARLSRQNLIKVQPNIIQGPSDISLQHFITSPAGYHLTFQQVYQGIPVYGTQYKVNFDKSKNIRSTGKTLLQVTGWNIDLSDTARFNSLLEEFKERRFPGASIAEKEVMVYWDEQNNRAHPVYRIILLGTDNLRGEKLHHEMVVTGSGDILLQEDIRVYLTDSLVTATIFNPDPLTTAGVTYGGAFTDNGDADSDSLDAQLDTVMMTVDFRNDTFYLVSPWAEIRNMETPNIPAVVSGKPEFIFTRSESGFEDVNTYYHINFFQQYMQSLGFATLVNYAIWIDTHGAGGGDNSYFSPGGGQPRLVFGEGGIDDAEDADVIIHEYGHAIAHSAAPNTNNGFERQALDEGLGDYLAASYSRSINEFAWEKVFTWDGHNEFWGGRNANTGKHYPEDVGSSYHMAGEIWSSALMDVWKYLGRDVTDQLVLQSIFGWFSNMTMPDAANLLLQADTLLNNASNSSTIHAVMVERGLLEGSINTPTVSAGEDQEMCNDSSVILNGSYSGDTTRAVIEWSPATGLSNTGILRPVASPSDTIKYTLTVIDTTVFCLDPEGDTCTFTDEMTIRVKICEKAEKKNNLTKITIRNTRAFTEGSGSLIISFPDYTESATILLFDVMGKVVFAETHTGSSDFELASRYLPQGIYILKIRSRFDEETVKVVKINK